VDALSDEVDRQLRQSPHIVVDLTRATFVDSTVVCALALGGEYARAWPACRFAVVAPADSVVRKVFDVVDLRGIMPMYDTLAEGGVRRSGRLRPV